MEEDVEFRRSLPSDWLNYMGVAFSDEVSRIYLENYGYVVILNPPYGSMAGYIVCCVFFTFSFCPGHMTDVSMAMQLIGVKFCMMIEI